MDGVFSNILETVHLYRKSRGCNVLIAGNIILQPFSQATEKLNASHFPCRYLFLGGVLTEDSRFRNLFWFDASRVFHRVGAPHLVSCYFFYKAN
jgi:hypothetical protein